MMAAGERVEVETNKLCACLSGAARFLSGQKGTQRGDDTTIWIYGEYGYWATTTLFLWGQQKAVLCVLFGKKRLPIAQYLRYRQSFLLEECLILIPHVLTITAQTHFT